MIVVPIDAGLTRWLVYSPPPDLQQSHNFAGQVKLTFNYKLASFMCWNLLAPVGLRISCF